jgi:hypothetical protein
MGVLTGAFDLLMNVYQKARIDTAFKGKTDISVFGCLLELQVA